MYAESETVDDYRRVRIYNGLELVETYKQYECGCEEVGTILSDGATSWGQLKWVCPLHRKNQ